MKKFILVVICLFYSVSLAQSMFSPTQISVEIFPMAKSSSNPTDSSTFTMQAISQVWGSDNNVVGYSNLHRKFRKNFGQKRCKFNKDKMLAQITQNSVAKNVLPMMYFILACIAILLYISSQDVYTKDK